MSTLEKLIEKKSFLDFTIDDYLYYNAKQTISPTKNFTFTKDAICSYLYQEEKDFFEDLDAFVLETELLNINFDSQKIFNPKYGYKFSTRDYDFYMKNEIITYINKNHPLINDIYTVDDVAKVIDSGYWYVYDKLRNNFDFNSDFHYTYLVDNTRCLTPEGLEKFADTITDPKKRKKIDIFLNNYLDIKRDIDNNSYLTINDLVEKTNFSRKYISEKVRDKLKNEIKYGDNDTIYLNKDNLENLERSLLVPSKNKKQISQNILEYTKNIPDDKLTNITEFSNLLDSTYFLARTYIKKHSNKSNIFVKNRQIYIDKSGLENIAKNIINPSAKNVEFAKKLEEIYKDL